MRCPLNVCKDLNSVQSILYEFCWSVLESRRPWNIATGQHNRTSLYFPESFPVT